MLVITKPGLTGRDVERGRHICSPTAHSHCRPKRYQMSVVEKRNRTIKPKSPSPWKSLKRLTYRKPQHSLRQLEPTVHNARRATAPRIFPRVISVTLTVARSTIHKST